MMLPGLFEACQGLRLRANAQPRGSGYLQERFLAGDRLLLTVSAPSRSDLLPTLHPASTLLWGAFGALPPLRFCLHPLVIWRLDASAALRQVSTLLRTPPRTTVLASAASGGTTVLSRSLQRGRQQSLRTATRAPRMARTPPATGRTWPAWGRTPRMRQVQGLDASCLSSPFQVLLNVQECLAWGLQAQGRSRHPTGHLSFS